LNASSPYLNKNVSNDIFFNPEIKPLDLEITKGTKNGNSYCVPKNEVTTG